VIHSVLAVIPRLAWAGLSRIELEYLPVIIQPPLLCALVHVKFHHVSHYLPVQFPFLYSAVDRVPQRSDRSVHERYDMAAWRVGNAPDEGHGIAADAAGNAYVTGHTFSLNFPTVGPLQSRLGGSGLFSFWRRKRHKNLPSTNAFVTKVNPEGSALVYSTYLGGSDGTAGSALTVDRDGNVYVVGGFPSGDFPMVRPLQRPRGRNGDAFVAQMKASGSSLLFSTALGGKDNEAANAIALDPSGNIYVAGFTYSTDFPLVYAVQPMNRGGAGASVAKISLAASVAEMFLGPTLILVLLCSVLGAWWWARRKPAAANTPHRA